MENKIGVIAGLVLFLMLGNTCTAKTVEKGTIFYIPGVMAATVYNEDMEQVIANINVKNTVPVVDEKENYYKVVADGWVEKSKIGSQKKTIAGIKTAITKEEVELLDQADKKSGKQYCSVRKKVEVSILEEQDDWLKVRLSGWTDKTTLVENSKVVAQKVTKEQISNEKKDIEMIKWDWSDASNSILIRGVVKNNSEKTYHFMKLKISITDEKGAALGDGESFIGRDEFKPGSQASFSTYIDGAATDSKSIKLSYKWTSADDEIKE
ncbi:MAG: hypothetical protein WC600_18850 [Desulfobaccales bacterium]